MTLDIEDDSTPVFAIKLACGNTTSDKDKWYDGGLFGTKLRNLIKDFSYKGKQVNSQNKLFEEFKKKGIIDTKKEGKVDSFKILK